MWVCIYLLLYLAAQTQHPTAKSGKTAHPIRYKGQTQGVFKKGGGDNWTFTGALTDWEEERFADVVPQLDLLRGPDQLGRRKVC
jgi:hypothetical protein